MSDFINSNNDTEKKKFIFRLEPHLKILYGNVTITIFCF